MIRILLSSRLGELRWTQADLARKTGIRPTTINELYHEMTERVNLDHLDLICEALDCSLDELIVRVPNSESRIAHTINGSPKPQISRSCNSWLNFKGAFYWGTFIVHSKLFLRRDCSKYSIFKLLSK